MKEKIGVIGAKTHPAEYLLHKYWSRKPHNVVSHFIAELCPPGGVLVDPFCGSGVSLREGALLGVTTYGFDVNPVATRISSLTINPPSLEEFALAVEPCFDRFRNLVEEAYAEIGESKTRYLVHEVVSLCRCGKPVGNSEAKPEGRIYRCPSCNERVFFNLESLHSTRVIGVVRDGTSKIDDEIELLKKHQELSGHCFYKGGQKYNQSFTENRRILAFNERRVGDLFTPRNFSLLCFLADQFHDISDSRVREAALTMLTASVVQCSRLIAYRNNMTTGGPAWSVPGFWIPPVHIETNPLIHLSARYEKFKKGLVALRTRPLKARASVVNLSATQGLGLLRDKKIKADMVFFDPPYGDSVPFVEFSFIWNTFLRLQPSLEADISVSDRMPKLSSWEKYFKGLHEIVEEVSVCLKPGGKLVVTFNNHDIRAWEALLHALQSAGFSCEFVAFQIPAVVSAKAQLAPEGSYVGDLYCVFKRASQTKKNDRSLAPVIEALKRCAISRGGQLPENLVRRVATTAWLENNIVAELLSEFEPLIKSLFSSDSGKMSWRGALGQGEGISSVVRKTAEVILRKGPCEWADIYQAVARSTQTLGIPDPGELRSLLGSHIVWRGSRCLGFANEAQSSQLVMI